MAKSPDTRSPARPFSFIFTGSKQISSFHSCTRISLTSSVERYYGDSIRETMLQVLEEMDVKNADIEAVDHGALDCTIRARMVIAIRRACREEEPL